jgi:hypothetical protein
MGLLLLGKGGVWAHRFERPLAAELDESEQRPTRGARALLAAPFHGSGVSARTQLSPLGTTARRPRWFGLAHAFRVERACRSNAVPYGEPAGRRPEGLTGRAPSPTQAGESDRRASREPHETGSRSRAVD